ncbi:MAG: AI-2E family transporter, partial [Clostridia bacterium]|nr:AI-2E family transporter [Clostridia bacterium]
LLVTFGIPIINQELNEVSDAIPGLIQEGQQCVNSLYSKLRSLAVPESIGKVMDESFKKIEAVILREMRQLANSLMGLFSQAISIFLAPILAFYILKDWNGFSRKIMFFPPAAVRDDFISLWAEIDDVLMCFIRGHLIVAILVAVFSALGLKLVGMNYVLLLSIIIGIMELIPYFGPIIGSVFAISLALLKSKTLGVYVFIVMVVIQQLESNIISPAILGESVGLHPIMIIFALLAGGKLFGFIGLLLAVPVSAVLKIIMGHVFSLLAAR